jgi:predicted SprT family Zn-dependent metalloprotease
MKDNINVDLSAWKNEGTNTTSSHKAHGHHEYNSTLEDWVDEMKDRFPVDLDIEFIEVSPRMTSTNAKAYMKPDGTKYIRVSEDYIYAVPDRRVKMTVLHEMCHIYFYQVGYPDANHDKFFRWVVGRVGASMTHCDTTGDKWVNCIEPFLDD